MKICFFTDTFFPTVGGAEMVLHNLAVQLGRRGEEVYVLAPKARKKGSHKVLPYPVWRYGDPSSKRFLVRQTLVHLLWLYLGHRFDLLHCHAAYPQAFVGATFKKWFHVPMVVRPHGSDIVPGGRMRRHRRVETRLYRGLESAEAVIVQGRYLHNVVMDLGIEKTRIRTIHNGVDLKGFRTAKPFPFERPYILVVGSLIHRKGVDILLRAYSKLEQPYPDLLIAGSGREEVNLKRLSRELEIEERVTFLGLVEGQHKVDLFRSAEFLVCPSRNEPFSNVILEALAAGLPVVASAIDGNTELVHHGVNGLLFSSEDVGGLAEALGKMIHDKTLMDRLRSRALDSVKDFDWSLIAGQYLSLYRELVQQNDVFPRSSS
jgi:glycosyltransferase involved in cell wall biosynthesis